MIDFEVIYRRPLNRGLRIELSSIDPAASKSVWVSEGAFGFLEPSIKTHCEGYKEMSHWGVTEIRHEEWLMILDEWRQIAAELASADTAERYTRPVWFFSDEAKKEFREHFGVFKRNLIVLIQRLSEWIAQASGAGDPILMKGI
jgi:hypothetical protein